MDDEIVVEAYIPEKLVEGLFEPHRYKVGYGGRGAGKSWAFARALLMQGTQEPLRILCTREFQSSINDSVHKLLSEQIRVLQLDDFYTIEKASIRGENGTEFRFAGIKTNVSAIKSFEGVDRCWVEEAANVSEDSWDVLRPTIRKENSEIWITFNPESEHDYTYKRFVLDPPPDTFVAKVNYYDNAYFPDVLMREVDALRETDLASYNHIYLGEPRATITGAIYANELAKAISEGRIMNVPYDMSSPVHTAWDLGFRDSTSIWFAQVVGMEFRIIDFFEDHGRPIQDYLHELQSKGYVYGQDFLPHDAKAKQLGTGRSIEEILRGHGRNVVVVPRLSLEDGIAAARTIFGRCYFDDRKTSDGRQALSNYRYNQDNGKPVHDFNSHAADSFRYLAVMLGKPLQKVIKLPPKIAVTSQRSHSWMGR